MQVLGEGGGAGKSELTLLVYTYFILFKSSIFKHQKYINILLCTHTNECVLQFNYVNITNGYNLIIANYIISFNS